jgi:hypothetical protein
MAIYIAHVKQALKTVFFTHRLWTKETKLPTQNLSVIKAKKPVKNDFPNSILNFWTFYVSLFSFSPFFVPTLKGKASLFYCILFFH